MWVSSSSVCIYLGFLEKKKRNLIDSTVAVQSNVVRLCCDPLSMIIDQLDPLDITLSRNITSAFTFGSVSESAGGPLSLPSVFPAQLFVTYFISAEDAGNALRLLYGVASVHRQR
ncbi:hypothetical protein EVAR_19411_1 [Eumeta japonica]|uniref:Uncharacterized protein n=1 Tax=Eumeta variegata TaxID=151549 RepID=A0A4C1TRM2_EUMVA|nr:hypothetical protein EVAR_19411_1 [Eumeta japonica]